MGLEFIRQGEFLLDNRFLQGFSSTYNRITVPQYSQVMVSIPRSTT